MLPPFGPFEDAMLQDGPPNGEHAWRLAHSALGHAVSIGLLLPGEVCDAVEDAYRAGAVPIASAEGFIRQVIGWREYVWGLYRHWMPEWRSMNALGADREVPPAFLGGHTRMNCVAQAVSGIELRAWVHHIQRLVVLANLGMLAGVSPPSLAQWMRVSFIDGAEWVMLPNVIGMGTYADGGRMATKPYAAGGAYINRMSDYCRSCVYDPSQRAGPTACPFTTLYWGLSRPPRRAIQRQPAHGPAAERAHRLRDLDDVRARATEVLARLDGGDL